jgi:DNA-binding response OmpR family regulator
VDVPDVDGGSVLIVEDERDIRETLAEFLRMEGFDVHTAKNGRLALDFLGDFPGFCVILLDLAMPVMDGWQFLEHRQQQKRLVALPVIVVSAFPDRVAPKFSVEAMIRKPVDFARLVAAIRNCLDRSRQTAENSSQPPT